MRTVKQIKVNDIVAKKAGFNNHATFEQAKAVVETGKPELIEAMDKWQASISAAAKVLKEKKKPKHEAPVDEWPFQPLGDVAPAADAVNAPAAVVTLDEATLREVNAALRALVADLPAQLAEKQAQLEQVMEHAEAAANELAKIVKIIDVDDRLAAARAELRAVKADNAAMAQRHGGLMEGKNELIRRIKSLRRALDAKERADRVA